ncbi:hypothetical protein RC91_00610 [Pectobacterium brasiliense]|uniref:DUF6216 family protein n=1 Tax=Pectobacterium brasiliense TaxID=180957 RepID=UPI00057EAE43|nr:DUF6216 family protein [Pectobacterium brasiliense]KHT07764.1 hypothetical protein RC91_00610 [Pectobacterium brasiliense]
MTFQFNSFISYLSDALENKLLFFWAIVFLSIFYFLYLKRKTGSGFFIANKFFTLWGGRKNKSSGELIDDIIEIEQFNFQYNTRAISKRQKNEFEIWIRKYELDFKIISKLEKNLDIEILKVRKVKKAMPAIVFFSIFIPLIIAFGTFGVAVKPAGLININHTGWIWFNKKEVTKYNFLGENEKSGVINPELCTRKDEIKLQFDEKTINLICDAFTDQKTLKYIDELINEQQYFFGTCTILLLLLTFYIFMTLISLLTTYDARIMILHKIRRYRKKRPR